MALHLFSNSHEWIKEIHTVPINAKPSRSQTNRNSISNPPLILLSAIYGGFARSCIAKTMEDNVQNEYLVTDENGCATDTSIFGNWEYNPDTNSLLASFNAFKFPSSDNIRFQCNIRVCFGKCQPVNCGGYNAFGRRRRSIADNSSDTTAIATSTGVEGQLREEITISSNAILTFEKRSGPGLNDANSKWNLQR